MADEDSTRPPAKRKSKNGAPYDALPAWLARDPALSPGEKLLLLVLSGHAWGDTFVCWPSTRALARDLGRTAATVRRLVHRLERRGLVRTRPGTHGTRREFVLAWKEGPDLEVRFHYEAYLRSPLWAAARRRALRRAGSRCQVCNADGGLEVHHRTYERLGREHDDDLFVLCAACHGIFHANGRLAGRERP